MSDTRDPAEEQQIADPETTGPRDGEYAPAIDAVGMGEEDPEGTDLDSTWVGDDDE